MIGSDRGFSGRRLVHLSGVVALCAAVAACAIGPRKRSPSHKTPIQNTLAVEQETPRKEGKPLASPPVEDAFRQKTAAEVAAWVPPEKKPFSVTAEGSADILPVPVLPKAFAVPVSVIDESRLEKAPIAALRVRGLEDKSVRALLGEPGLLRRDPPAEVWQYRASGCVADLFLYEDKNKKRVAYVQVRSLNAREQRVSEAECLNRIAYRRKSP